jgi:hypothetical protein
VQTEIPGPAHACVVVPTPDLPRQKSDRLHRPRTLECMNGPSREGEEQTLGDARCGVALLDVNPDKVRVFIETLGCPDFGGVGFLGSR